MKVNVSGLPVRIERRSIEARGRKIPLLLLLPKVRREKTPAVLWIHGGGYMTGMKEMTLLSRGMDLARRYGAVVVSPGYRLSFRAPYPAAIEDCYEALLYLKHNAAALGADPDRIMVGGESAGGGLTASLCMLARDRGEVKIAFQMPLYPMIDNFDTETSKNNHGKVWDTRRNHRGWRMYLRENAEKEVSPYAAAARQTDYRGLPPAYTFVGTAEPFYAETLVFIHRLRSAGVEADLDIYKGMYHAYDLLHPRLPESREAKERFFRHFEYALEHYFAPQEDANEDQGPEIHL